MDKLYDAAVAGGNPFWVIGPQFCDPHVLDLVIDKKPLGMSQGKFIVTDTKGNLLFKVKKPHFRVRDQMFLVDAAGNHIVTLKEKVINLMHVKITLDIYFSKHDILYM